MMKFLRYNSRHRFYWNLGGGRDNQKMQWPQIDPISSVMGGGLKVISFHEPLWMFRLRQRLFAFAGKQRCGRRAESWHGQTDELLPDTWDVGPDDNRTCSYCGSIHFDDLMAICRKVPTDPAYGISGTDKAYKVYVNQPGVMNASQGAIKFYKHHSPAEPTEEQQQLFINASRISHERFVEKMNKRFPPPVDTAAAAG